MVKLNIVIYAELGITERIRKKCSDIFYNNGLQSYLCTNGHQTWVLQKLKNNNNNKNKKNSRVSMYLWCLAL